jgi:hypothetical protein
MPGRLLHVAREMLCIGGRRPLLVIIENNIDIVTLPFLDLLTETMFELSSYRTIRFDLA